MSTSRSSSKQLIIVILVAMASACAGFLVWQITAKNTAPVRQALLELPEPRIIADFALVDQDGTRFDLEKLKGRWSLLFFGFTHCPDICPTTLYDLQKVKQAVPGHGEDWQAILVSVDPERDSPARLKEYIGFFDQEFLAITGDPRQLLPLSRQLGIAYHIEEHEPGEAVYDVDHSAGLVLMDPEGRQHGLFPAPHDVNSISADMISILD